MSADAASDAILDRLTRLHPKAIDLSLDRMRTLLTRLGNPETRLPPVFHVAGTNGKGSVSAMLESVLRASGLRTGLYTSPHLIRFNERIRVGGEMIPDADLIRLLDDVERADQQQAAAPGHRPGTFFELTTAVAFQWFLERQVQLAVLETGMGGRLDSTNVALPLLA